jgi:hypothetical protein
MPPLCWPADPVKTVQEFETRRQAPTAGALLAWAAWTVDGLRYLDDIDRGYDATRISVGSHRPDIVDVAHARWATGTCITALDLCAAGLARAFCGHNASREIDMGELAPTARASAARRALLPQLARSWVDAVHADHGYTVVKEARDWLTHSRVRRHFSIGGGAPVPRLDLETASKRLSVRQLVHNSVEVAERHVVALFGHLPSL